MAEIRNLLNPAPELDTSSQSDLDRPSKMSLLTPEYSPGHQTRKKQKLCKDAAVFTRGPIRGQCRYPPHEYQDEMIAAQHQQFELYPIGKIADYPRHIPYNSEKKLFQDRTGRESLEVFQYQFKVPGDDTQYAMLWDYNIGLVRTTPLFKCTGHSKTTPARMLNRNPGLREICHSITGGALVAQGYWMPYEAAKAVAATFCWSIRYALTPVFGLDFPEMCILPDSDKFGDMTIDPAITKHCTEEANRYRSLEARSTSRESSTVPCPLTPKTPTFPRPIRQFRTNISKVTSGAYSSDAASEDSCTLSVTPEPHYRSYWTPANIPRSAPRLPPPPHQFLSRKRPADPSSPSRKSSPETSPKSRRTEEVDHAYDGDNSDDSAAEGTTRSQKEPLGVSLDDLKAAHLLMSMRMQQKDPQKIKTGRRRASA